MNRAIRVLYDDQVFDCSRTCFIVGMERVKKQKHLGFPVFEDVNGNRFIVKARS